MTVAAFKQQIPVADALLALAFIAVAQVEIWVFNNDLSMGLHVLIVASVFVTVAGGALAWRRVHPAYAFWLNSAAVVFTISAGFTTDIYQWTNLVAIYSVAAHGTASQSWAALPAGLGGVVFYFIRFPDEGGLLILGFSMALWLVAWLTGKTYGSRLAQEGLRVERDLSVQIAATRQEKIDLEEAKARIARELHDIIGHTVNVMVVHAGAGRRAVTDDLPAAIKAFEIIEETGREALDQLDSVLAVLNDGNDRLQLEPPPGIADLATLGERATDPGFNVEVEVVGSPASVPSSVGLASYRIAQEALTNAMKHSGASTARVRVEVESNEIRMEIADNGKGVEGSVTAGRGIVGMRERAAMHNGDLDLNSSDGGTTVTAVLRWGTS